MGKLQDDVDQLFKLPLAEFIDARNTLAKRLKQSGSADDANLVKTLAKPSVSAWTVNQLYWNHREAFDTLLAAGQRFRKAQSAGKVADMRGSLNARREALTHLADLAASLLSDAGHNPSQDTIHRITTTLEAISAYASLSDGPTLGRLSQDVDPPGFESLASFVPAAGTMKRTEQPARVTVSQKTTTAREDRQVKEARQVRIAAAKFSLQAAKKSLADARVRAQSLEAEHKKAYAQAKQAEKQLREAEERFKKARAASEAAAQRSQTIADEVEEATKAVEDAKRTVETASRELESLFSEAPA
jgi:hypothetical protein